MLHFAGIDVQRLLQVDLEYYATARDAFAQSVKVRVATLHAQNDLIGITGRIGSARHIEFLPELKRQGQKLQNIFARTKTNIVTNQKLQNTPVPLTDNLTDIEADLLAQFTIMLTPELGMRSEMNGDAMLIFFVHEMLASDKVNLRDPARVRKFVEERKEFLTLSSRGTWIDGAIELHRAACKHSVQNAKDYLNVLTKTALKVEHKANDAYLAALELSYLLDLYLQVKGFHAGRLQQSIMRILENKIVATIALLQDAPDPSEAADQYFAKLDKNKARCLPAFTCLITKKRAPMTERERQMKEANRKPLHVRSVGGMSVW